MKKIDSFQRFIKVVKRLRKECPWDRKQTHNSIKHSLIEEAYEVIEAIDKKDFFELKKELGDLLLHVIFHTIIAEEKKKFKIEDVINSVTEKLIRRHPHVFGTTKVKNAKEVKQNWESIKLTEGRNSVLDGVPKEMPALLRAMRIQEKASKVGFDWKKKTDVWKKVLEEINELEKAEYRKDNRHIEEEFGDILFTLVNYSRFLRINPEFALTKSINKFIRRFSSIESELKRRGKKFSQTSLKEMDKIWDKNKKRLK